LIYISDCFGNYGADSKCAIEAWDIVDELEAEATFYGVPKPGKSARKRFSENPQPVPVG
jgi:nicotinic acid mononucleotide adenylyltransferase